MRGGRVSFRDLPRSVTNHRISMPHPSTTARPPAPQHRTAPTDAERYRSTLKPGSFIRDIRQRLVPIGTEPPTKPRRFIRATPKALHVAVRSVPSPCPAHECSRHRSTTRRRWQRLAARLAAQLVALAQQFSPRKGSPCPVCQSFGSPCPPFGPGSYGISPAFPRPHSRKLSNRLQALPTPIHAAIRAWPTATALQRRMPPCSSPSHRRPGLGIMAVIDTEAGSLIFFRLIFLVRQAPARSALRLPAGSRISIRLI
ncbi:hypothetical protein PLANPX_5314 [Lacipirellula parvula]|uniref:Uncharacterized protein n=1 Tax=Lacipirellula parvula TaxID=2650471 RepID=A0A5K7XI26_9BACT|nr:hypothetical protein PLANPX_5314 [Lacipirellula parvula]